MLVLTLIFYSYSTYAQSSGLTLDEKASSLKQVIEKIEKISGYNFLYNAQLVDVSKIVNISKENVDLRVLLNELFRDTNISYKIVDKQIILSPKDSGIEKKSNRESTKEKGKKEIKGKVSDEAGRPIPGATILVKGTTVGTATNIDGVFSLTVPEGKKDLLVSFIGYTSQEFAVAGSDNYKILLRQEPKRMDEVVVTGYQTISKERATGSYTVIDQDALKKPATSLATQLIGTSSGLQATIDADGNATGFTIRGQSSIGGFSGTNNSPLVVVDGFPIQDDFRSINPNDVKSVSILKDAASASIWGARAANGVIVVTTKNAQKGTPLSVEISSFVRIGSNLDLDYYLNRASSAATIDFEKYAFLKWGDYGVTDSPNYFNFINRRTAAVVAMNEYHLGKITLQQRDDELNRLSSLDNKGQIKKYMLQRPISQQYNVTISGATERMNNTLSLLYNKSQSTLKGNGNNEYMLNYRVNAALAKWLDLDASSMVQYSENQTGGYTRMDIQSLAPYEMLVNPDGSYNNIGTNYYYPLINRYVPQGSFPYANWNYNPIQDMNDRSILSKNLNTRIQAGLTFKLLDGLRFSSKAQYELFNTSTRNFQGENTFYVRQKVNEAASWDQATGAVVANLPKGAIIKEYRYETCNYNFRNQLDFNRTFNDLHNVTLLVGTEVSQSRSKQNDYPYSYGFNTETYSTAELPNGTGYPTPLYNWVGWSETFSTSTHYSYNTLRNFSFYGNASYTFNNRYNISGSFRTDASNFISDKPKYRYSPFWSVGASWTLSSEPFMANYKWIDRLALRGTFGYNGNSSSNTSFKPLVGVGNRDARTGDLDVFIVSSGNPTLRWEKTGTTNIGLDYSFFNGKLYGNLDFYNKHGKDILASVSMPAANGDTQQSMNNAEILNQGVELTVGTNQSLGSGVTWNGSVNFSYNRNEVKKLFISSYYPLSLEIGSAVEGKDMSTLWVYRYGGIKNLGTETSPNLQPVILGSNGKLFSVGESLWSQNGLEMMKDAGTRTAPYTLGMSNSFTYKNFDLSFAITGLFGHKYLATGFNYPQTSGRGLPNSLLSDVFADGKPLRGIEAIELPYDDYDYYYGSWKTNNLDYQVRDAWNIRMQNINLSYNLPKGIISKFNLSGVMAYAQVNNVFVLKAYKEDPDFRLGSERYLPSYTFGVKVNF